MKGYGFLVDTSAFVRMSRDVRLRKAWRPQVDAGMLAICPLTELEILYSARSREHRGEIKEMIDLAFRWVVMPDKIYKRAEGVQEILTGHGLHRSAGPVDLLIAATAEAHGLTLLHYDADFEHVAAATGQPVRWLAEPGSID